MSADQTPPQRRVDVVALVAGVLFVFYSVISLTVGSLDLPQFGAAPLWLLLITVGVVLLVSELRSRKDKPAQTTSSRGSAELDGWDQDPYR
ncbi:MAG: hypothetical protein M3313_02860 [Actinomycetota bacterium]|nr:hypothetical protein [Actinomycetota bacterium]